MSIVEIGNEDSKNTEQRGQYSKAALSEQYLPEPISGSEEALLATHGRTFHFAARFFPPMHRQQIVVLYAFFRVLDDLVDIPVKGRSVQDIREELEAWRRWFSSGYAFPAPREPIGIHLASILAEHPVPVAVFSDFLDGLAFDLEPREVRDFQELYHYCYGVAGTVGLAMTHVLNATSSQTLAAAQSLGIAMQLTNILRDVGGDLASGRIYLPQDELARFGSSRHHLTRLYQEQSGPDERFRALMRYQIARAHRYYVRGMAGIWLLPRDCRLPILVAARLYRRILTAIERKHYDVLRSRAATSLPEKLHEAAIAFTLAQLWHQGEENISSEMEALLEE